MSKRKARKEGRGHDFKTSEIKLNSLETSQKNKVLSVKSRGGIVETENIPTPASDSGLWLTSVRIWVSNLFGQ